MTKLEIAIKALKDIEDPISALRRNLKPGEQLDGRAAVSLSEDSNYLKAAARQALNEIDKIEMDNRRAVLLKSK